MTEIQSTTTNGDDKTTSGGNSPNEVIEIDQIEDSVKDETPVIAVDDNTEVVVTKTTNNGADDKEESNNNNDNNKAKKETPKKESDSTSAPTKKKYTNWPLRGIKEPLENDVMYGRGGGTNHHPGNKRYRQMVEERKLDYVNSKRLDKPLVALDIIRQWRAQDPPGRFLKLDDKTGTWHDVGDKKAREKTSQALREKAPEIRKKQEEQQQTGKDPNHGSPNRGDDNEDGATNGSIKTTRFAEGTKEQGVKHAVLARDHSLGREYLQDGEPMTLEGFTWDEASMERMASFGSMMPPSPSAPGGYYPPGRITSHGSTGMAPPPYHGPPSRTGSHSSNAPPPPPPHDYYGRAVSGDHGRQYSGRHESWTRAPSTGSVPPPPMPGYYSGGPPPPPPPPGAYTAREHSLAHNPLQDATISQPANLHAFDTAGRQGSGYWHHGPPPPPPPSNMRSPSNGGRTVSGSKSNMPPPGRSSSYGRYMSGGGGPRHPADTNNPSSSSSYSVDYALAQQWSGTTAPQDFDKTGSGMYPNTDRPSRSPRRSHDGTDYSKHYQEQHHASSSMPRPDVVKRMTSNQNESVETKPDLQEGRSVKRAALNRDNSTASNRLKAQYVPELLSVRPKPMDEQMRMLSNSMKQSTITEGETDRPKPLSIDERSSTLDKVAMEAFIMSKPTPLGSGERTTTTDVIRSIIGGEDSVELLDEITDSVVPLKPEPSPRIAKPPTVRTAGRMTTAEYNDIVNEPIPDEEDQYGIQAV